jgi:hypothetical protein
MIAVVENTLTEEQVKAVLAQASDREVGLVIQARTTRPQNTHRALAPMSAKITVRNQKPGCVRFLSENSIGFNIDGRTYKTATPLDAQIFMDWLTTMYKKPINKVDNSQPDSVTFIYTP